MLILFSQIQINYSYGPGWLAACQHSQTYFEEYRGALRHGEEFDVATLDKRAALQWLFHQLEDCFITRPWIEKGESSHCKTKFTYWQYPLLRPMTDSIIFSKLPSYPLRSYSETYIKQCCILGNVRKLL